jgi:hypothetical protein
VLTEKVQGQGFAAIAPKPRSDQALDAMNSLDGWPQEKDY